MAAQWGESGATTAERMAKVSFSDAFARWYQLTDDEARRLDAVKARGETVFSWEALDHVCALAVEAGLKAIMLRDGLATAGPDGDFPRDDDGRRPHVDKLWDLFMSKAQGRAASEAVRMLGGRKGTPIRAFEGWRVEHRYAADGTVAESAVRPRLAIARSLKRIEQEGGL
jgi:hypothetical protein